MLSPKNAALLSLAVLSASAIAQEVKESDLKPATRNYRRYRLQNTEPAFGLAKVKAIVKGIKPDDEDNRRLPQAAFDRLSTAEKFTYCMLHAEDMGQNCDAMPWIVDEEHKVFAYPPAGDDATWSERQRAFLKAHRGEVVRLLRSTIKTQRRVGLNLKETISEIGAYELIPDLIAAYNTDRKDQDVLTVLMLLMKDGKYKPFLASPTYLKLYGPDASYQAYIVANAANQKLMAERAMGYYRSRVK